MIQSFREFLYEMTIPNMTESHQYKETRHDYIGGKQYDIEHSAEVSPDHTLVIRHSITKTKKGNHLETDFGFRDPRFKDYMTMNKDQLHAPLSSKQGIDVMSTVSRSVQDVIQKHGITKASFYANTDRKDQTYSRFAQRLARKLGGKHTTRDDTQHVSIPKNK